MLDRSQVEAAAPDGRSMVAASKFARPSKWSNLGHSDDALWGEAHGSRVYEVRVDRSDLACKCTCPSRKFPCKHGLALLLLAAEQSSLLPEGPAPPWVADWLTARRERAAKKAAPKAPATPEQAAARQAAADKRAAKRERRVSEGVEVFARWLQDTARGGLGGLSGGGREAFVAQAEALRSAQAPGLAARLEEAADGIGGEDWPVRLLEALGRLALLVEAWRNRAGLSDLQREDLRRVMGWTTAQDDVRARGEAVEDRWLVAGLVVEEERGLSSMRAWLRGARTGRWALLLQYRRGSAAWGHALGVGQQVEACARFYPSPHPRRCLLDPTGAAARAELPPLAGTVDEALAAQAAALAVAPWHRSTPAILGPVTPRLDGARLWLVDEAGDALITAGADRWSLLAASQGRPMTVAGDLAGRTFRPLSVLDDGRLRSVVA